MPGEDDAYTDVQLLRLAQTLDAMRSAGVDPGLVHVGATGGLLAGAGRIRATRCGRASALYGLLPAWAADREPGCGRRCRSRRCRCASSTLPPASRSATACATGPERATRIATLGIGYGDGWPRAHANNGWVLVRGQRVPIVGAISMDGLTVDLGEVP